MFKVVNQGQVARNAGLDPMAQNSWNQYGIMSGQLPLSAGMLGGPLSHPNLGQWETLRRWMDKGDEALEWGINQGLQVLPFVIPASRGVRPPRFQPLRTPGAIPPVRPPLRLPPVGPPVATPAVPPPVATPGGSGRPTGSIEQPQSWRPGVATPRSTGPATMPTKPMTLPEGPVPTTSGVRSPLPPWKDPRAVKNLVEANPGTLKNVEDRGGFHPSQIYTDPTTGKTYVPPWMNDLPPYVPSGGQTIPTQPMIPGGPTMGPQSRGEPEREAVASVDQRAAQAACTGPGQFWDGRQCRGSVGSMPGLPGGMPGEVTAAPLTAVSPGVTGMAGRRISYAVVNM